MQSETEPILFPEAEAASGSLSAEERLDWRQFGWGGYWQKLHRDSGLTANLPETNDADEE